MKKFKTEKKNIFELVPFRTYLYTEYLHSGKDNPRPELFDP